MEEEGEAEKRKKRSKWRRKGRQRRGNDKTHPEGAGTMPADNLLLD